MNNLQDIANQKVRHHIDNYCKKHLQTLLNDVVSDAIKEVQNNLKFKMIPSGDNSFKVEAYWDDMPKEFASEVVSD